MKAMTGSKLVILHFPVEETDYFYVQPSLWNGMVKYYNISKKYIDIYNKYAPFWINLCQIYRSYYSISLVFF